MVVSVRRARSSFQYCLTFVERCSTCSDGWAPAPKTRSTCCANRASLMPTDTIAGREVTSVSFRNLASSNSWGADLNGSLRLGPKFNGFAGFNVFKMVTDGGSTSSLGSDAVAWMGRVNGSTELSKTLMLQMSYFYRAPMKIENGRFEGMQMANFALRKKLNGDKATVTLRVNDPFGTGRFAVRAGQNNVFQVTERDFGNRMVWLAFQLNYGRPPRVRRRPVPRRRSGARRDPRAGTCRPSHSRHARRAQDSVGQPGVLPRLGSFRDARHAARRGLDGGRLPLLALIAPKAGKRGFDGGWHRLAAESDRMALVDIGPTAEDRTQWMAVVTSPANHARRNGSSCKSS